MGFRTIIGYGLGGAFAVPTSETFTGSGVDESDSDVQPVKDPEAATRAHRTVRREGCIRRGRWRG
jgi:hypothetical protein